jgi:hypothetical protein
MNHINNYKNHILVAISLTICIIALIATANQTPLSFDTYWHIATGKDFLTYGDSPFIDHFTFTHYGEEIKSNPIIFQIIIANFTMLFGPDTGVFILKMFAYASFLIAMYYFYKTNNINLLSIAATLPFVVLFLTQRAGLARPELLSYTFFIIMLTLYFSSMRKLSTKNLILICILLIVWGNYHTPVIGYIIAFGLFFEKGIRKISGREPFSWRYYMAWGVIIFLTGFINIKFSHFIFSQLDFSEEWKFLIAEFEPLSYYYPLTFRVAFFSSSLILMLWLFKKQQYGMLLVSILLVSQTWNIVRLSSFTGILISCLYSIIISELLSSNRAINNYTKRTLLARNTITAAVIAVTVFGQCYLSLISYLRYNSQQNRNAIFPTGVVNYLKDHRSKGNIFNLYHHGGYLAYALPRGFKTYIDGRTNILFSIDFYRKFIGAVYSPSILRGEVEKYDIKYAILDNDPTRYELIAKSEVFSIDYVDHYFFLATTGAANFPISGNILMRPACWNGVLSEDLSKEIERGAKILPAQSPLLEIQKQLGHYFQSKEKSKFHEDIDVEKIEHDQTRRVLAYQASRNNFQEKSIRLFYSINNKTTKDVMAIAMAFIKLGQYQDAYWLLESSLEHKYRNDLSNSEKKTLLEIFKLLSTHKDVEINRKILQEIKDIDLISKESLSERICNTQILGESRSIAILDYLNKMKNNQAQDD